MTDLPLFDFKGPGLDEQDKVRLTKHLQNFIAYVSDGKEHTLNEIAEALGMSQCSASARFRDVKRMGGRYEKRRDEVRRGLWHYQLTQVPKDYEVTI